MPEQLNDIYHILSTTYKTDLSLSKIYRENNSYDKGKRMQGNLRFKILFYVKKGHGK
jgi:hypothetical protein